MKHLYKQLTALSTCCKELLLHKCATQPKLSSSNAAWLHIKLYCCFFAVFFAACTSRQVPAEPVIFETLQHDKTGLAFVNELHPDSTFNVLDYMYFYNGAGVGAGDFNNDGRTDIFFASNQGADKIYLNEGGLHFKDASDAAGIPKDGGWSTGVSVVDINNDGLLDIYVCRVGNYMKLQSKNELLICRKILEDGTPVYEEAAASYGLDFSGFSTQAAFLDYDLDGDLDMYLLNHSVHQNGTFAERKQFIGTYHDLSGDKFFRNDSGHFSNVTKETNINSSVIGYGLGIVVADINLDGWPDIYIGNDFHENDYLYINQQDGTFKEAMQSDMMHTSQYTMGVDAADINNDGWPDIVSADMLPSDPYMLKRSLGEDKTDIFNMKIGYGYAYQYTRNNLQLSRRNGMFSEVGLYANMYATDWSWSTLWMDFDNDGWKDLFISNGIPKRLNDIDYVNFVSNEEMQQKMKNRTLNEKDMALINKFPEIKLPNAFFRNNHDAAFADVAAGIEGNVNSFSNGAVYADFDNDGDLDIVTSNIADAALLYRNVTNDTITSSYMQLKLKGPAQNINATGSKAILYHDGNISTYEKFASRGFLSSMETPLHIGIKNQVIDSAFIVWPDNTYEKLSLQKDTTLQLTYRPGLPHFDYTSLRNYFKSAALQMVDITARTGFNYRHIENDFNEFDREALIPQMLSEEGPALAIGDVNGDGFEDVFIGGSKRNKGALFTQTNAGMFVQSVQPSLAADSMYEDAGAVFADVNNDGNADLIIASGGNEFFGHDTHMQPRVYINNGKGTLLKLEHAFDNIWLTASSVAPYDFNGDGFTDLFIGGRAVPWEYGKIPGSYLLQNDGKGHFKDVTDATSKELAAVGFVTSAQWYDMDKDGDKDLLLSLQWGGIVMMKNEKGRFTKTVLCKQNGWWNFVIPADIDNDGDDDFIAGNLGLNSRLKATEEKPVKMYYNDFDDNGRKEQLMTYYLGGRELVFANKDELQKQLPFIKKKFLYADDFAKASVSEIIPQQKLSSAQVFTADYFSNAVFINDGNMNFTVQPLPWLAQLTTYRDAQIVDANNDHLPDVLLAGNFYATNIEMGRYDADYGTVLINKGNGLFTAETINGLVIKGQSRHVKALNIAGDTAYVIARNNDSSMIIQFRK